MLLSIELSSLKSDVNFYSEGYQDIAYVIEIQNYINFMDALLSTLDFKGRLCSSFVSFTLFEIFQHHSSHAQQSYLVLRVFDLLLYSVFHPSL